MTKTLILLLALGQPAFAPAAAPQSDPRAEALLRKVDDLWRGESSHTLMTMRVKTAHYQRTLRLEGWSKGSDRTFVRILKPEKEKGTVTLKAGEAIYTYLPRTDRTIKLNAGMMAGSWMGSHFTNDDLVHESRMSRDYVSRITFEGVRDGRKVVDLELKPREGAAVVWGRIRGTIDPDTYDPIRMSYDDEDLKPVRTLEFGKVKDFGRRRAPSVMRLVPVEPAGEWTEMEYEALELDVDIQDGFFSLARLKRRAP